MLFLLCLNTASPWDREVESVSLDQKAPKSMDDAASETVDEVVQKQPHIGVSSFECYKNASLSTIHHHKNPSFLGTRKGANTVRNSRPI